MKSNSKMKRKRKRQSEVASLNGSSKVVGKRSCVINRPADFVVKQFNHKDSQVIIKLYTQV